MASPPALSSLSCNTIIAMSPTPLGDIDSVQTITTTSTNEDSPAALQQSRKRARLPSDPVMNSRKGRKVSRACDYCKQRKIKCSGTLPCTKCTSKASDCVYDASYSRGRPPTPPPLLQQHNPVDGVGPVSRASPELGMAEIGGQVFDPTSGMTFLHRAWRRLLRHIPGGSLSNEHQQVPQAGDRPLPRLSEADLYSLSVPSQPELDSLIELYFDVCIATYRVLHRPSVQGWVSSVATNLSQGQPAWKGIGRPKAAIVFVCLAVAIAHVEKSTSASHIDSETVGLARSDHMFAVCTRLLEAEADSPSLMSAQALIIQTLYLLTTARMDKAWYVFGNALQEISALGLHRRATRRRQLASGRLDYLQSQLGMRTFWTAYMLDKYLGVVFGRPRHYHDEDIDQDYPDQLEDEDMTPEGPVAQTDEAQAGCHNDALVFHAK